jgi:hypothetical protein
MKTHLKAILNVVSIALVLLSFLLFFIYLLYTADVRNRYLALQRGTATFFVSQFDERIQALRTAGGLGDEGFRGDADVESLIRNIARAVAGHYDEPGDELHLLLFDAAERNILYPEGAPGRLVSPDLFEVTAEILEGPISLDDRFGYFVRYTGAAPHRIGIFAYSFSEDVFRSRNRLLYIVSGVTSLFTLLAILVVLGVFVKWRRFIAALKTAARDVLDDRKQVPRRIEGTFDVELRDYLTLYNRMVDRLEANINEREGMLRDLSLQRDNLKKVTQLYRKYIPDESLLQLDAHHIEEIASRRQRVVSLSVELTDFVRPTGELYPQVITKELSNFVAYVKNLAVNRGGILNLSYGYRVNLVFGVPDPSEGDYHNALLAAQALWTWVEERNRSEMNISGIPWHPKMGLARGDAIVGIVGESYMALGEVTDSSAELLRYARRYQVGLVSDDVGPLESPASDRPSFTFRKLDRLPTRDNSAKSLYQVFLLTPSMIDQAVRLYHHGLEMYYEKKYEIAVLDFKKVLTVLQDDVPSRMFLRRCEEKLKT